MYLPKNLGVDPSGRTGARRQPPRNRWFLGVDLGQRRDHSAIAALELSWHYHGRSPLNYDWIYKPAVVLRRLQHFPVGTDYEEIPPMLYRIISDIDAQAGWHPEGAAPPKDIVIDGGGPGPPVVDRIRRAIPGSITLSPVIITGGTNTNTLSSGYTGVPRRTLLSNLLLLIGAGVLRVPQSLEHWERFEEECAGLSAVGGSHPAHGHHHDDLVIAAALAVSGALRCHPEILPPQDQAQRQPWEHNRHHNLIAA